MEKKKITIEVEPATAVATVGLLRGIFPSIIEQLERQAATNGSPLKFNKVENMQEVLMRFMKSALPKRTSGSLPRRT